MKQLLSASQELLSKLPPDAADSMISEVVKSTSPLASEMRRILSPAKLRPGTAPADEDEEGAAVAEQGGRDGVGEGGEKAIDSDSDDEVERRRRERSIIKHSPVKRVRCVDCVRN